MTKATPRETASMMTIEEAAQYLQQHPLTVRRLAWEGAIPAFKVGRQWRVKRKLLDQWFEEKSMQNINAPT
jgi:excisionase family DNA binding protein